MSALISHYVKDAAKVLRAAKRNAPALKKRGITATFLTNQTTRVTRVKKGITAHGERAQAVTTEAARIVALIETVRDGIADCRGAAKLAFGRAGNGVDKAALEAFTVGLPMPGTAASAEPQGDSIATGLKKAAWRTAMDGRGFGDAEAKALAAAIHAALDAAATRDDAKDAKSDASEALAADIRDMRHDTAEIRDAANVAFRKESAKRKAFDPPPRPVTKKALAKKKTAGAGTVGVATPAK